MKAYLAYVRFSVESGDVAKIKQATFYCTTALLSWNLEQANYSVE